MNASSASSIAIDLSAAIVAVKGAVPLVLTTRFDPSRGNIAALPAGVFDPDTHRTFEIGLRSWVTDQTGLALGYVEQLYTFGDRGRHADPGPGGRHHVSVGYLALTRSERGAETSGTTSLQPWYTFFPWEDWRQGRPVIIDRVIMPHLMLWADDAEGERSDLWRRVPPRKARLIQCFGGEDAPWDEEKTLERYELLYEAGLVAEAARDSRASVGNPAPACGEAMLFDHRRILATAIGRLRAKLKYRPVIFELMPESFTLTALQTTAEAISGHHLHKQNFRRQVEGGALVEPTGQLTRTTGRPAALFRFRREVVAERPAPGLRVGTRG
jgi:hypothetical protein